MMRLALMASAVGALALTAACADYYGDYAYAPYGDYYGANADYHGSDYGPADYGTVGFYDGYYGPYYDGYWGPDGFFYFQTSDNDGWHRDSGQHFRHQATPGFHPVRGRMARAGPAPRTRMRGGY
ncbi:MAG TPA: hypothetical protein VGS12_09910 [Caulobacteraceae bacterium]|nr:hypothetical protein [Caulobacteraceae bacterium]